MAAYTAVLVLLLAVVLSAAQARTLHQVDHTHSHGDHGHEGTFSTTLDRLDFNDQVALYELRGLWLGEGDQYSYSVYDVFSDPAALPDCSAHLNEYNYSHYSPDDDHYIMFAGTNTTIDRTTAAHQTTTQFRVLNYTNNILGLLNNKTGATTCSFWEPFVDLRTGLLKAEIVNMNMYTRNATGQRVAQSLNCQVVGNELPGCYTRQVARTPGASTLVQSQSLAAAASAPGPSLTIPDGAVVSVNIQTYVCRNGECLTLSPKYAEGHSH